MGFERMNVATTQAQQTTPPVLSGAGKRNGATGTVLDVRGVTKRFKDVAAVDDLSFTVQAGEVLGFLGPNGAGKSTTVGMILGLIRPTSGSVLIHGTDVHGNQHVVSESVGAIIENPAFYPYLSGRDNLKAHALAVGGVPDARIDELLSLVN